MQYRKPQVETVKVIARMETRISPLPDTVGSD